MKYNYFYKAYLEDGNVKYGVHETDVLNDWLMDLNNTNQYIEIIGMFPTIEKASKFKEECKALGYLEGCQEIPVDKIQSFIENKQNEVKKTDKPIKISKVKKERVVSDVVKKPLYSNEDIEIVKSIIENKTVDFSRCGWVGKLINMLGVNKGVVHKLMSTEFPNVYENAYHHVERSKQVWITKDNERKRIAEHKLKEFLDDGWTIRKQV